MAVTSNGIEQYILKLQKDNETLRAEVEKLRDGGGLLKLISVFLMRFVRLFA